MEIANLVNALKMHGIRADEMAIETILEVARLVEKKASKYSLKDFAKAQAKIHKKYPPKHREYEYDIVQFSYRNSFELADMFNSYGKDGWVIGVMVKEARDTPEEGMTTQEFVAARVKI